MSNNPDKILLFTSKDSIYFQTTMEEFQKLFEALKNIKPLSSEIVDVSENPDAAEQFKIEALPTIIIGDKRFIGQPKADDILKIVRSGY